MGWELTDSLRRAMERAPAIRSPLQPPKPTLGMTVPAPVEPVVTPAQQRWQAGEEKALSALVVADLRRRGYFVVVSRTDKPTSQQRGIPDLIACRNGKVAMVELKAGNGKLSAAQRECHNELILAGVPVCVAYNFDDAINFVRKTLLLP